MITFPELLRTALKIARRDGFFVFLGRLKMFFFGLEHVSSLEANRLGPVCFRNISIWSKKCPLVTIVIPCYNYGKFIMEAVESVIAQTFCDIEILIINDGSTDQETIHVLKLIEKKYKRTKVIHQKNQGLAQTRNNGMKMARGKYVCFLDADDSMDPTYVEKTVIVLERNQHLGSAYSWLQCFGDNDSTWKTQDLNPIIMRNSNVAPSHSMICKSVWKRVKEVNGEGFITKYNGYFEDWVFWIDMVSIGFGGWVIPESLIHYRVHSSSLSATHKRGFSDKLQELHRDRSSFFLPLNTEFFQKNLTKKKSKKAFLNIGRKNQYLACEGKVIVLFLPWLVCGGVETITLFMIQQLKLDGYTVVIFTTEESSNEWQDRFKNETALIYNFCNFLDQSQYEEFVICFLRTRNVSIIGGIHSKLFYHLTEKIHNNFPKIKIFDVLHNDAKEGYIDTSCKNDLYLDKHLVVSQRIRNSLEAVNIQSKKIHVIYNFVDANSFKGGQKQYSSENIRVAFLGRFSPEKRPLDFLKIAWHFRHNSRMKFFMAGGGVLDTQLKEVVQREKLNRVFFCGLVDPREFLKETDIVIISSDIEGLPMSMLEAMAMKNTVISTNVGDVTSVIKDGENGFLIKSPGDIKMFVSKLEKIMLNTSILKRIGNAARKTIERDFNIGRAKKEYSEFFKQLQS